MWAAIIPAIASLIGTAVNAGVSASEDDDGPDAMQTTPPQRRNYMDVSSMAMPPAPPMQAPQPVQLAALERAFGRR